MNQQLLLFGVSMPLLATPEGTEQLVANDHLHGLVQTCQHAHVPLMHVTAPRFILPLPPADAGSAKGVLGVVVAALYPDRLPCGRLINHFFNAISMEPSPEELLELRLIGGLQQAAQDWQVVRLAAAAISITFAEGRLWLVTAEDHT
jgi:hypothetical protein